MTVTSRNNADATATCLVDYAERVSGYTLTLSNGGVTISSSDPEYTVTGNSSVSISKGEYTKTVGTVEENFTGTYVIRGNASFAANMSSIGVNATVKQVSGSVVPVGEDIFTSLYQLSPQGGTPFPSMNQLMDMRTAILIFRLRKYMCIWKVNIAIILVLSLCMVRRVFSPMKWKAYRLISRKLFFKAVNGNE